jgi:arylsulfatase A-like enzyme
MKQEIEAENALIFVSDALRWDYLPDSIREKGVSYKGVAQGIATHTALPSIMTGLYPRTHGVYDFTHRLASETDSLLDYVDIDSAYVTSNTWWDKSSPFYEILGVDKRSVESTEDLDSPWIFVQHDKGGHAPFDGKTPSAFDDSESLIEAYKKNVRESTERFHAVMDALAERGSLKQTLIVLLGDHGELLGEHGGFISHGYPLCPELVYVPVTFIHPEIPEGKVVTDGVIEQVDILPTLLDAMGRSRDLDGVSIFNSGPHSHGIVERVDYNDHWAIDRGYVGRGVFERNGGHVFHSASWLKRVTHFLNTMGRADCTIDSPHGSRNRCELANTYLRSHRQYADPGISRSEAKDILSAYRSGTTETESYELDQATKDAMEDLGYL